MRSTDFAACVLVTCAVVTGQQGAQQGALVRCGDLFAKFQQGLLASDGEVPPIDRFVWICERLDRCETAGMPNGSVLNVQQQQRQALLVLQGTQESVTTVQQIIEQLRAENPLLPTTLRLQCSLVTVPANQAAATDFPWGKVVPVDEIAMGKYVKAALAAKGSLQNLPEVLARPLVPFVAAAGDAKVCNETGGSSVRVSWRQADSSAWCSPTLGAASAGGSAETPSAAADVTVSMDSAASTVAASIVTGSTTAGSGADAAAGVASKAAVSSGAVAGASVGLRSLADRKMSSKARPGYG